MYKSINELISNQLARRLLSASAAFLLVSLFAGCASTKVTDSNRVVTGSIAKPGAILVYDFVATLDDMPADVKVNDQPGLDTTPQTPEQIAEGRKLGALIAQELAAEIREMGLQAQEAGPGTQPQIDDIVIRGYLLSIKEGSAAKRVSIGFGSGESGLTTAVEGFQMTATGLRKLGSGTVEAGGSKGPGAAVGLATFIATANPAGLIISGGMKAYGEASGSAKVEGRAKATAKEIAEVLKKRFQEEGWIE